ncbi:MAG: aldehyde dehydrogenase family protein [Desulfobacteraceae bacterium]|nr:aldehyde dehydrogenase family protein [Desulfobacteraceae bacterium]
MPAQDAKIIAGGMTDDSKGYFVEPTVILADDPEYESMTQEIFGPVLTMYVYKDDEIDKTLEILDTSTAYALTGAIFAQDRYVINQLTNHLKHSAGNFYINDKPTGAVVGQQPFGGARASGTNDKAGSLLNLLRWVSPRTIKETFVPAVKYKYE